MDLLNLNPNPDPHAHTKPKRTKKERNYPENNFGTLLTLRVPLAPELVSPAAFTPARPRHACASNISPPRTPLRPVHERASTLVCWAGVQAVQRRGDRSV
jgi:hypothetical protein